MLRLRLTTLLLLTSIAWADESQLKGDTAPVTPPVGTLMGMIELFHSAEPPAYMLTISSPDESCLLSAERIGESRWQQPTPDMGWLIFTRLTDGPPPNPQSAAETRMLDQAQRFVFKNYEVLIYAPGVHSFRLSVWDDQDIASRKDLGWFMASLPVEPQG